MQVDPVKLMLKPPGTQHLKLKCDILLSTFAFKFNLRRYTVGRDLICERCDELPDIKAGRCRLTLSNPR